jgi:hypothetical protein
MALARVGRAKIPAAGTAAVAPFNNDLRVNRFMESLSSGQAEVWHLSTSHCATAVSYTAANLSREKNARQEFVWDPYKTLLAKMLSGGAFHQEKPTPERPAGAP